MEWAGSKLKTSIRGGGGARTTVRLSDCAASCRYVVVRGGLQTDHNAQRLIYHIKHAVSGRLSSVQKSVDGGVVFVNNTLVVPFSCVCYCH